MGRDRPAKERRGKTNLMDGLLESSPHFLPFLKDELADVMRVPVGKLCQRKLGCKLRTLSGRTFAHCRYHGVAG